MGLPLFVKRLSLFRPEQTEGLSNSDGTYAGSTQLINVVDISGYTDRSSKANKFCY